MERAAETTLGRAVADACTQLGLAAPSFRAIALQRGDAAPFGEAEILACLDWWARDSSAAYVEEYTRSFERAVSNEAFSWGGLTRGMNHTLKLLFRTLHGQVGQFRWPDVWASACLHIWLRSGHLPPGWPGDAARLCQRELTDFRDTPLAWHHSARPLPVQFAELGSPPTDVAGLGRAIAVLRREIELNFETVLICAL